MMTNTRSAAASMLLPLILALSFECLLSHPMAASNQQFAKRASVEQQYQRPAPLSQQQHSLQPQSPRAAPVAREAFEREPRGNFVSGVPSVGARQSYATSAPSGSQNIAVPMDSRPEVRQASANSDNGFNRGSPPRARFVETEREATSSAHSSHNLFVHNNRDESARQQEEQLSMAQRILEKINGDRNMNSFSADGINVNNHQTTFKVGNNKNVNVNSFSNTIAPDNSRTQIDEVDVHTDSEKKQGGEKKKKATPEQKELKATLLRLADKATEVPEGAMVFNEETQTYEPIDASARLYKQKLHDALKALSSKKLNVEKIKKALEGGDGKVDRERNPETITEVDTAQYNSELDNGQMMNEYDQFEAMSSEEQARHGRGHVEVVDNEAYGNQQFSVPRGEMGQEDLDEFYEADEQFNQDQWARDSRAAQSQGRQQVFYEPDSEPASFSPRADRQVSRSGRRMGPSASVDEPNYVAEEVFDEDAASSVSDELEVRSSFDEEFEPLVREVRELLGDRLNRLVDMLYFRPEVLNQLLQIDDRQLAPIEAEFKRMVLCNSDERFCNRDLTSCPVRRDELPAELEGQPRGRQMDSSQEVGSGSLSEPYEESYENGADFRFEGRAGRPAYEVEYEPEHAGYRNGHSERPQPPFLPPKVAYTESSRARSFDVPPAYRPADGNYRSSRTKAFYAYEQAQESGTASPREASRAPQRHVVSQTTEIRNGVPVVKLDVNNQSGQQPRGTWQQNDHQQAQVPARNRNAVPVPNQAGNGPTIHHNNQQPPSHAAQNRAHVPHVHNFNRSPPPTAHQAHHQPGAHRPPTNQQPLAQQVFEQVGPPSHQHRHQQQQTQYQQSAHQQQARANQQPGLHHRQPQGAPARPHAHNNNHQSLGASRGPNTWQGPGGIHRMSTAVRVEPNQSQTAQPAVALGPPQSRVSSDRINPFDMFPRQRAGPQVPLGNGTN